jgi:hypothetical protein
VPLAGAHYDHRGEEKISLPPDLARDTEEQAKAEGKTLSAIVQEALREARAQSATETTLQRFCAQAFREVTAERATVPLRARAR